MLTVVEEMGIKVSKHILQNICGVFMASADVKFYAKFNLVSKYFYRPCGSKVMTIYMHHIKW